MHTTEIPILTLRSNSARYFLSAAIVFKLIWSQIQNIS